MILGGEVRAVGVDAGPTVDCNNPKCNLVLSDGACCLWGILILLYLLFYISDSDQKSVV